MVEITLKTPRQMIEADSGYFITIGGAPVAARHVGTDPADLTKITLAVPAAAIASAPAEASLTVTSGGSRWVFGPITTKAAP